MVDNIAPDVTFNRAINVDAAMVDTVDGAILDDGTNARLIDVDALLHRPCDGVTPEPQVLAVLQHNGVTGFLLRSGS